ncbi:MAG TPA: YegP family protein [Kofleriaceae bacterium]
MRNLNSIITVLFLSFATISAVGCAAGGDEYGDEYDGAESSATAPGKIDLYQSSDSQWRFRVRAGNGATLLSSEAYVSKAGAQNGIASVLENGVDPAMYQVNQTASGKFNLRLRAANYEVIGFTQQYSTKSNATRAIGSCVRAITTYLDSVEGATQQSAE